MAFHVNGRGICYIIFILTIIILFLQTKERFYEANTNLESTDFVCNEMIVEDGILSCSTTSQEPVFGEADSGDAADDY